MNVSLLIELPESLHDALRLHLSQHPGWDQERVMTAALALFLLQNGDQGCARSYLDAVFPVEVDDAPPS
ncbi:MAG: hypothetical protein DCF22_00715 [Leptolyngbya sp.]|nr:MAG: hypothetical protein DCF22_00715 [Leptolyngbya sp.]